MKMSHKQEVETSNTFGILNYIDQEDENTNSGEYYSTKEKSKVKIVQKAISVQRGKQVDHASRKI